MNDELVSVLVPKSLVTRLYAWVASQTQGNGVTVAEPETAPAEADESTTPAPRLEQWTPEMVERMVRDSAPQMRRILKLLAERSEEWVTTDEFAAVLKHRPGVNHSFTVAGTMGAFGRRHTHRYHDEYGITTLPFEGRWDYEKSCKINRMPKQIAVQVQRALKKFPLD